MSWIVFALLAAVFTSASALFEKKTLQKTHAASFVADLSVINFFIALILFAPLSDFSQVNLNILLLVGFACLLGAVGFLFITKAMRHMEVSTVSPMLTLEPGLVALFALFLLGEKLAANQWLGIVILVIGTLLLETAAIKEYRGELKKLFFSPHTRYLYFAVLIYSLTSIFDRLVLSRLGISVPTYTLLIHTFQAAIFIGLIMFKYGGLADIFGTFKKFGFLIFAISLFTVLYRFFQMQAVALASIGLVIAIKRTSSLFTTIIGGEIWHEHNLGKKIIACVIMVIGAVLVVV